MFKDNAQQVTVNLESFRDFNPAVECGAVEPFNSVRANVSQTRQDVIARGTV